ncbi:MAG: hypothetical protein AB7S38_23470 [Vulcanimicrobiota bacterium]
MGLCFWLLPALSQDAKTRRVLLLVGCILAAVMLFHAHNPWLRARLTMAHLLGLSLVLVELEPLVAGAAMAALVSNLWAAQHYFGQDTLSNWLPLLFAGLALLARARVWASLTLIATGWLLQGGVEMATPSWLRTAPWALPANPLFFVPSLEFSPFWLGAAGLLLALASLKWTHPGWLALLCLAALAGLPFGGPLSARKVASLVGQSGHLHSSTIPELEARLEPLDQPKWLAYSNNPENIRRLESDRLVLFEQTLPAGRGRLYASHFNTTGRHLELAAILTNFSDSPIRLECRPRAEASEPGMTQAWDPVWPDQLELAPGHQFITRLPMGLSNGRLMLELASSGPLDYRLCLTKPDDSQLDGPLAERTGGQSRGLFLAPDRRLRATYSPADGPRLLTLDRNWLSNGDDTLVGNYGALTEVELQLSGESMVVLVPTGGWADGLYAFQGRVLHRGAGPFRYQHRLTTNSYAPVRLLLLPLD